MKLANVCLPLLCCLVCSTTANTQTTAARPIVEPAPRSNAVSAKYSAHARQLPLSDEKKLALVRSKIKYVFVLFQENRSFDFYFGTYPGAYGLYSQPAAQTAGLTQPIVNVDGSIGTVSAFRIPSSVTDAQGNVVPIYPTDTASVNHAHLPMVKKLNFDGAMVARNDRYALTEEGVTIVDGKPSKRPTLERKQFGELVMGHVDCDAAPFLWRYADRFALFDHFFDTVVGPSGPNAIAMIAGQSGETQWMLHPDLANGSTPTSGSAAPTQTLAPAGVSPSASKAAHAGGSAPATGPGTTPAVNAPANALPLVANAVPYYDLPLDPAGNPAAPRVNPVSTHAPNLTFATLPLSFMGSAIEKTTASDFDPVFDLQDVKEDIAKIAGHGVGAVPWGWYQQGYGHEPTDPVGVATHKEYVLHHNGPQYFGYVANNPLASAHMHGLGQFFEDVEAKRLPASGVFYVRGGYGNIFGMPPADPNPRLATVFNGDDDHPGYADSGVSEVLLAKEINAIARSPYWKDSVIMIAYDESDGLYDNARPRIRSKDAAGMALDQGARIPFMLISPYGEAHVVSHEMSEHSSIIKFVDQMFSLVPLADLPDEERGRALGRERLNQNDLGPADDKVAGVGNLLSGFSNARLLGKLPLLPASYAEITEAEMAQTRRADGVGCRALGIRPTDAGRPNPLPDDFNPRPDTTPGLPRSGTWVP